MRLLLILIVLAGVAAIVWLLNRAREESARPALEAELLDGVEDKS